MKTDKMQSIDLNCEGFEQYLYRKNIYDWHIQYVFKFDNNFGASVVKFKYGLEAYSENWGLVVLHDFDGTGWEVCYTSPIKDENLHNLTEGQVRAYLGQIRDWGNCDVEPRNNNVLDTSVVIIEASQIEDHSSIFGNEYCYITREQLDDVANGKIIKVRVNGGEYQVFIGLPGSADNQKIAKRYSTIQYFERLRGVIKGDENGN